MLGTFIWEGGIFPAAECPAGGQAVLAAVACREEGTPARTPHGPYVGWQSWDGGWRFCCISRSDPSLGPALRTRAGLGVSTEYIVCNVHTGCPLREPSVPCRVISHSPCPDAVKSPSIVEGAHPPPPSTLVSKDSILIFRSGSERHSFMFMAGWGGREGGKLCACPQSPQHFPTAEEKGHARTSLVSSYSGSSSRWQIRALSAQTSGFLRVRIRSQVSIQYPVRP